MLDKIRNIYKNITFNRVTRIIFDLEKDVKKTSKDVKQKTRPHFRRLRALNKKVRMINIFRTLAYILLYISIFSAILGDIIFIETIISYITMISGLIGAAILLVAIAFLNRYREVQVSDAHIEADYIVSMIVHNKK